MGSRILSGLFVALFLWVTNGLANPILVQNSSFENPVCGPNAPITCNATNWAPFPNPGASLGAFLPFRTAWDTIPDGLQVGFSNGGTLTQGLSVNITPDTVYTLSVWVSQRWSAGTFLPEIQLFGGSTSLLLMNNASPGGVAPTQLQDGTYNWVDWRASWVSPHAGPIIGQTLLISLGSDGIQTDFDFVSLDATDTPEPGMFLLVAGGLLGLGIRRRLSK